MSDTPELIKGVLVNGQIHKIDYNALANKPSIPSSIGQLDNLLVPDNDGMFIGIEDSQLIAKEMSIPESVDQLTDLLISENNGKCVGIDNSQLIAKEMDSIKDYIVLGGEYTENSSIYSYVNSKCVHVGAYAFLNCTNLSYVEINNNTYIGDSAFCSCYSLESAMLGGTINIGSCAFQECYSLNRVVFHDLACIGSYAFAYCENLREIYGHPKYIGGYAFSGCRNLSIRLSEFLRYTTFIGIGAFDNAIIVSGPGVDYISISRCAGENAFSGLSHESGFFNLGRLSTVPVACFENARIRTVYAPYCTLIEGYAFNRCRIGVFPSYEEVSASNVLFPNVTHIERGAFCSFAIESTSTHGLCFPKLENIEESAFYAAYSLSEFIAPECSIIGSEAFCQCGQLYSIDIPKVTKIKARAFMSCYSLQTISLPNTSIIGASAFTYCSNLYSIYLLSSSVTQLDQGASYIFSRTPIMQSVSGTYGSIYVPSSLYSNYVSNNRWSRVASRIVSM